MGWTGISPDILVTEQKTNLFECLVLGLGEEEIRDDSVGSVGRDVDEEILPTELVETVGCNLTDDDIVEPIGSGGYGGSQGSLVHGEDFRLVDPRDRTERGGKGT